MPEPTGGGGGGIVIPWWVVYYQTLPGRVNAPNPGGRTQFEIVRANTKDDAAQKVGDSLGVSVTKTTGPYDARHLAQSAADTVRQRNAAAAHSAENQPGGNFGWLTGLGGGIASGIEGGVVAVLKDLWRVVEGPLLVIAGIIVALIVLSVYFKNDIAGLIARVPK